MHRSNYVQEEAVNKVYKVSVRIDKMLETLKKCNQLNKYEVEQLEIASTCMAEAAQHMQTRLINQTPTK